MSMAWNNFENNDKTRGMLSLKSLKYWCRVKLWHSKNKMSTLDDADVLCMGPETCAFELQYADCKVVQPFIHWHYPTRSQQIFIVLQLLLIYCSHCFNCFPFLLKAFVFLKGNMYDKAWTVSSHQHALSYKLSNLEQAIDPNKIRRVWWNNAPPTKAKITLQRHLAVVRYYVSSIIDHQCKCIF